MRNLRHFEPTPIPNKIPERAVEKLAGWRPALKGQLRIRETSAPARPRIAAYLRYSTDRQDDYSFDRQLIEVRGYAARLGGDIVLVFGDAGESGYWSANRPEFKQMLQAAERRQFDILLIENGDRLSRRVHITTTVFAKLGDCRIEVHSTRDGRWSLLQAALAGAMSEEQRNRLSEFIRSGIIKLVSRGLWPGRAPYGYEKAYAVASAIEGQPPVLRTPGDMRIVPQRATVVRRAFKMRAAGIGCDTIADIFAAEEVEPPFGGTWTGQTIRYMLRNAMYVGVGIYCKTRQYRMEVDDRMVWCTERMSPDEWLFFERPDLAIIDDLDDWHTVQRLMREARFPGPNRKSLLSRLMVCGTCGGPLSIAGNYDHRRKIKCSTYRRVKRGGQKCAQPQLTLESVEDAVISLVCEKLQNPAATRNMQIGFDRKIRHAQIELNAKRREREQERAGVRRRLDATHDAAMVVGLTTNALAEQRRDLCARLEEIDAELASIPAVSLCAEPFAVAPPDSADYLDALVPGHDYQGCDEARAKLVATFRALVGQVVVFCDPDTKRAEVRLEGPVADVDGAASKEFVPATRLGFRIYSANRLARRGAFAISDSDWEKICGVLPCGDVWIEDLDRPLPLRSIVEAVIFLKRTRIGAPNLPDDVWPHRIYVWAAARMLSYAGILDVVEDAMRKAELELIDGIGLRLEANRSRKLDPVGSFLKSNERRRAHVLSRLKHGDASAA
jgi:site-specific DNA recombinase